MTNLPKRLDHWSRPRPGLHYRQVVGRPPLSAYPPPTPDSFTREMLIGHWYDGTTDPRITEEQTYDEAYGPRSPHRNARYLSEWDDPIELEAVLIRVAVGQQVRHNARYREPFFDRTQAWENDRTTKRIYVKHS